MDIYDQLNSTELLVPNITTVVLTAVIAGSKPESSLMLFSHPDDVASGVQEYENIGMVYSPKAKLRANRVKGKALMYNIGGIHMTSFLKAVGATDEELVEVYRADRDTRVDLLQRYIGEVVNSPITGRVKGDDGVTRIAFKFEKVDYDNLDEFIERQKTVFSSVDPSLAPAIEREAAHKRNTRPDDAVVPSGMQEGDELLA